MKERPAEYFLRFLIYSKSIWKNIEKVEVNIGYFGTLFNFYTKIPHVMSYFNFNPYIFLASNIVLQTRI